MAPRIVKVGGSLFDLPELPARLRSWLDCEPVAHHVLVTGGGVLVEQVRTWHARQPIDEVSAHWICVDLMTTTAQLLHSRMPELSLCSDIQLLEQRCKQPGATIFIAAAWLRDMEPNLPGMKLPENWEVTSDAIAGRLAIVLAADELVLLKSTLPATSVTDLDSLAEAGLVDPILPRLAPELSAVRLVNLRLGHPWKQLRIVTRVPVANGGLVEPD